MNPSYLLFFLLAILLCFAAPVQSEDPVILNLISCESTVTIQWQADTVSTQWVDRCSTLTQPIAWVPVFTNLPPSSATNTWVDTTGSNFSNAFYRIRAQGPAVSSKIGQTAVFTNRYHGVAGTAEILDEDTIRVTGFYYDGTGILVYMIITSDDPSDNSVPSYTIISDDLILPGGYVNNTLDFTIPPEVDLTAINYISVWCIEVPVSFGDGNFQ